MKSRTVSQHRDLQVLEALAEDHAMTQRALAGRLDIAVGLANLYVKRLIQKGFIKCVNVRPNRIRYLLTPKGISEKTRLTYEFMDYSLRLYRQARARLMESLPPAGSSPRVCIYIHGSTEAAELTYLALRERGIEPAAILTHAAAGVFLGMPIQPLSRHSELEYDVVVVATLERPEGPRNQLLAAGIPQEKIVLLTPLRGRDARAASSKQPAPLNEGPIRSA